MLYISGISIVQAMSPEAGGWRRGDGTTVPQAWLIDGDGDNSDSVAEPVTVTTVTLRR